MSLTPLCLRKNKKARPARISITPPPTPTPIPIFAPEPLLFPFLLFELGDTGTGDVCDPPGTVDIIVETEGTVVGEEPMTVTVEAEPS